PRQEVSAGEVGVERLAGDADVSGPREHDGRVLRVLADIVDEPRAQPVIAAVARSRPRRLVLFHCPTSLTSSGTGHPAADAIALSANNCHRRSLAAIFVPRVRSMIVESTSSNRSRIITRASSSAKTASSPASA